jgi:uncharacterized protein
MLTRPIGLPLISERDDLHIRARDIVEQFSDTLIVTSDRVLVEVLNGLSTPAHFRRSATNSVTEICADEKVCVVPQTRELFDQAHSFYRQRMDEVWSLTDRASFVIMRDRSLTKALTQNGYEAVLRD